MKLYQIHICVVSEDIAIEITASTSIGYMPFDA